jgi:hypothetical protein
MLRFLRWILNRFIGICFVIGLPLGLIMSLGGGALSWIFGRSEFLDDVILYGIAAAAASFLLIWLLPKVVGWVEYLKKTRDTLRFSRPTNSKKRNHLKYEFS